MPPDQVQDKNGNPIQEGDQVWTKMRGGKHEGQVDKIVTSKEEADAEGVKNPPKSEADLYSRPQVLFQDQHGHDVAHNPGTLQHSE
ncbi:hypothetical protein HJFPF1_09901 [Paramyrothecium foliicola]|nr:hypothetical protein HJFPF1_09901 [Paramyrothecium foliicola]